MGMTNSVAQALLVTKSGSHARSLTKIRFISQSFALTSVICGVSSALSAGAVANPW
jgi:hypothetical protein